MLFTPVVAYGNRIRFNRHLFFGKEVELNIRGNTFAATVLKINDEGELVVRTLDNEELTVYSGEITRLVLNDK